MAASILRANRGVLISRPIKRDDLTQRGDIIFYSDFIFTGFIFYFIFYIFYILQSFDIIFRALS